MLGQQINEGTGKEVGRRILEGHGSGPVMGSSFQEAGKILGVDVQNSGTYTAVARPDGTLYGDGQGIAMSREGDVITWKGHGIGKMGPGSASWRGALYFQTASPKFARLNSIAGVYEYEIDMATGTQKGKMWEWK